MQSLHKTVLMMALLSIVTTLTACMQPDVDADSAAQSFLQLLNANRLDEAYEQMSRDYQTDETKEALPEIAAVINHSPIHAIQFIRYSYVSGTMANPDDKSATFLYQIELEQGWAVAQMHLQFEGGTWKVVGATINQVAGDGANHSFSFARMTVPHYLMLLAMVAVVAFIAYSLYLCIRTKDLKRKWLWLFVILVGVGQIQFNWTTTDMQINIARLQFLGIGYSRPSEIFPWIFSFTLPMGALLFQYRLRRKSVAAMHPAAQQSL